MGGCVLAPLLLARFKKQQAAVTIILGFIGGIVELLNSLSIVFRWVHIAAKKRDLIFNVNVDIRSVAI